MTTNKAEEWRDVIGAEGLYQVSNKGRVKSNDRIIEKFNGSVVCSHRIKGKILKPCLTGKGYLKGSGYLTVDINRKGKKVHRLVAEAFIPNPNKLPQVNHKDGNKTNNSVENLEWCTNSENSKHAVALGLRPLGEEKNNSKLNREIVLFIRKNYICGDKKYGQKPLARKFGVAPATIKDIVLKKKWRHIT